MVAEDEDAGGVRVLGPDHDLGLGHEKPKFTRAIKSPGYCIAFTEDGKAVFTGHDNGSVAYTPLSGK